MNILDKIIATKIEEVEQRKKLYPIDLLHQSIYFNTPVVSLGRYLKRKDRLGVIAEFKRQSPSAGIINAEATVEKTSIGYMQSGASALSILTDKTYFGGNSKDLTTARTFNFCPILRKDFIIDEYQVYEARSIGADAILLIAACLEADKFLALAKVANSLGLEVLMEVHEEAELSKANEFVTAIGVNNRDLKSFKTNIEKSKLLFPKLSKDFVKVSESGISKAEDIAELKQMGFDGFLIGGFFMNQSDPALACRKLIKESWKKFFANEEFKNINYDR